LPKSVSQPALRVIDELLVATVAGCAGEESAVNLTAAVQSRALLAMRYGGALPGAETTAPAQHISSEAAIERFIAETGARLELEGAEPSTLRRVRERIRARAANALAETLTPLELDLASDVRLINEAHADPAFRELRNQTTRGGDERRRAVAADGAPDGGGEAAEAPPLVDLNDLGRVAGKSRALSDGLWGRAYLGAYEVATAEERLRMVEGLSKGAGLALLAIPMAEPFTLTQAQFQRTLGKYLGTQGQVTLPWTHHCGSGNTRVLTGATVNHLEVCPMLGRGKAPHNAVRDALMHMVVQCGVTDAAVVETPVTSADGSSTVADVVYLDNLSGQRVILEVSVVTMGSDSSLAAGARAGLGGVRAQLQAREREKRNHGVIQKVLSDPGNNTIFTPIVLSASGAMGPSMVEFLKSVYERAQSVDKFDMRRQPKVVHTWNTSMASTYWDMRLSVACAATDAEFQNRLMARDQTLNLPVVERQPHPDPNRVPYSAQQQLAGPRVAA